jgi:hypothetical protein
MSVTLTYKQVDDLRSVLAIQGEQGNFDYDEYMRGMYNGMELMMAIIEKRDPVYKEAKED